MKAAILAGGAGTRLYPITAYVPKVLIPVAGRYVIEYVIDYLKTNGIHEIVMLVSNAELELLKNHLGDGKRFGMSVEYSVHSSKNSICTIALSTNVPIDYGVARVAEDGRITYFQEKPVLKEYPVSMGIDILDRDTLTYCLPNTDLAQHVIPKLLADHKPVFAYVTDKRHYDIGTFKSLEEVRALFEQQKTQSP